MQQSTRVQHSFCMFQPKLRVKASNHHGDSNQASRSQKLGSCNQVTIKEGIFQDPKAFLQAASRLGFLGFRGTWQCGRPSCFLYHSIIIASGHKNPRNVAFPVHQKMHLRKPFDARLPGNCATALPRAYHNPACNKSSRPSQVSDLAKSSGQKLGELVQN